METTEMMTETTSKWLKNWLNIRIILVLLTAEEYHKKCPKCPFNHALSGLLDGTVLLVAAVNPRRKGVCDPGQKRFAPRRYNCCCYTPRNKAEFDFLTTQEEILDSEIDPVS